MSDGKRTKSPIWTVRVARAHWRLATGMVVGALTFALLLLAFGKANGVAWLLLSWDAGAVFYLVATAIMMGRSSSSEIHLHSEAHDEGAFALLMITVSAAVASLAAIFVELAILDAATPGYALYVVLSIATVVLSWMLIHTIFALHYAYEFYGDDDCVKGLKFPDDDDPDYWDFVYFSFVIGMTFQVSDVAVSNKILRRMVVAHGALSFFFTTAIVALTVNIAASIIHK